MKRLAGMKAFYALFVGQSVSLLGGSMTRFAIMIWAYEREQNALALALLGFFNCLTYVITSPIAGVLVDRWPRRKVMILADLCAGMMTLGLMLLFVGGKMSLPLVYLAVGLTGIFEAFQEPASWASISTLVPPERYTRINGLIGLGKSAARLLAPAGAGFLLQITQLQGVMIVDVFTMALAVGLLFMINIPAPQVSEEGRKADAGLIKELRFGIGYIWKRPGLRGLLGIFFFINLFATTTYFAVHAPMILARSGGDEVALGITQTVMGVGGVIGGFLIAWLGTPRRKALTFVMSTGISFFVCDLLTAVGRVPLVWAFAGFLSELSIPYIVSPYYAIWQERVPQDVQGRVFSTREMLQIMAQPAGFLLGGLLADNLFEPAMQNGGLLAGWFGDLLGTGPGAGMALMFLCTSVLGGLTGLLGWASADVRAIDYEHETCNDKVTAPVAP